MKKKEFDMLRMTQNELIGYVRAEEVTKYKLYTVYSFVMGLTIGILSVLLLKG